MLFKENGEPSDIGCIIFGIIGAVSFFAIPNAFALMLKYILIYRGQI